MASMPAGEGLALPESLVGARARASRQEASPSNPAFLHFLFQKQRPLPEACLAEQERAKLGSGLRTGAAGSFRFPSSSAPDVPGS